MAQASDYTLELLRQKFRDEMNDLADHISSGGCSSFEEYKHGTGVIEGLARAERALLDLDENLGQD